MKNSGGTFEVHRLESMAPSMNTGSIETHIVKRACNTEVSHSARNTCLYQMATVFFAGQGTLAVFKRDFRSASSV